MKNNIYLGLVHYPVKNREQVVVTTSITNLDIHDIARSCLTFGIKKYLVITPVKSQQDLFGRIIRFWQKDLAETYNPDRVEALKLAELTDSLTSAQEYIRKQEAAAPIIVTTTALKSDNQVSFAEMRNLVNTANRPIFLLFGTGNGLSFEVHEMADYILTPITGRNAYNHLSVRSAVAIVLDRLSSDK